MNKLVRIDDPIIVELDDGHIVSMGSKDSNPVPYSIARRFIDNNGLQLGDDILECIRRSVRGEVPVRPEPTEEQKNTKKRGLFSS